MDDLRELQEDALFWGSDSTSNLQLESGSGSTSIQGWATLILRGG